VIYYYGELNGDGLQIAQTKFISNEANISAVIRAHNLEPGLKNVEMKNNKAIEYGGDMFTFPSGLFVTFNAENYFPDAD
jgi:hypothetical protein